jgi:DNA-binding transcriptional MocR family regulator
MPDAAKERLVKIVSSRGIPLIEDDVFGELAFGATRPRAAKAFDTDGSVMLCGSFSKTLAAGYRVGYAAPGRWRSGSSSSALLNVATATSRSAPSRASSPPVATTATPHPADRVARNVARMAAAIAESFPAGTRVSHPAGGCFLWVEMPPRVDALELHARALDAGVSITPGPLFSPTQGHRSCVRLSCGGPWTDRIDAAVRLVGRLATRMAG